MSLMSVLNVGARALQTSQLAIDITGQNISNEGVEGYSRKRLNLATLYSQSTAYGQIGLGAAVVNIERMRNVFVDEQIRKQNTEVGYFTEVNKSFQRIETVLTEPSDFGVMSSIDDFFNSWQNLSNNPDDLAARTMVLTEANIMVDYFHKTAQELADLRQQKNDEIPLLVKRVNQITQEIYNLNQEVMVVEAGGVQNANDSRDRRDLILKELAQLIDITVVENTHGQVTVTTCGGVLVAPAYRQELETSTAERKMPDGKILRDYGVRFASTRQSIVPNGGQIRGLIDSRDVYIPEYQARLDELALALVKSVNELHYTGYNLNGNSGYNFFDNLPKDDNGNYIMTGAAAKIAVSAAVKSNVANIAAATAGQDLRSNGYYLPASLHNYGNDPVQLYRNDGTGSNMTVASEYNFTYDSSDTNPVQLYHRSNDPTAPRANNIIAGTVAVTVTSSNTTLVEGTDYTIDYRNGTITMLDPSLDGEQIDITFESYDPNASRAYNIIAGTVEVKATINGNEVILREGIDYNIDYRNGTVQMLHDGYDNTAVPPASPNVTINIKFDYYVGGFKGPEDNSNALAIAELRTQMTMTDDNLGNPTATFAEYVSSIIGRLGLNTNQSASNLETRIFLAYQYEEQQEMVAGVSTDEEMANLIRFEHTYTAAARLISTVDQMLETLLNM